MEKIAYLLDIIGEACDISGDIRDAFLRVQSDVNYLGLKDLGMDANEWTESYRSVFGVYPLQEIFQKNVDEAIRRAEGFIQFGNLVRSVRPDTYESFLQDANELLRRLGQYRNSIPAYFPSS